MDAVENYGSIRGNPRTFHINDETFSVKKMPAKIQMDFLAWRIESSRPVMPKDPEKVDENIEYRTDTRNEFEFMLDSCAETLNASRTQDQKNRFEVTVEWLLENVSADMLDKLIYAVMDPFLSRLEEKQAEASQKLVKTQKTILEPTIREIVRQEMETMMTQKKPSPTSAKQSAN